MCFSSNPPVVFDRIVFRVVAELIYTYRMLSSKSARDVGPIRPDTGTSNSRCVGGWVERDRSGGRGAKHAGLQASDADAIMAGEATSTL
jgi:hypothetical protein